MVRSSPLLIASLTYRNETGALPAIAFASESTSEIKDSAGTTLVTKPISRASAALMISAVRISSRALPLPIIRGNRWVPPSDGIKPDATSGNPKRAFWEAILISQARASSSPSPKASPLTAAITGFSIAATDAATLYFCTASSSERHCFLPDWKDWCSSLPPQKTLPAPVIMTT